MHDATTEPLPQLPERQPDAHKGTFGRVLAVGGSRGMAGSISLTGLATLRSGAGLVTIATPRCVQATVAGFCPAYMTVGLADDDDRLADSAIDPLLELAANADHVALGPGLGRSSSVTRIVERLYRELTCPMVVDADGLNALSERDDPLASPGGPRILTPHPGEFARLIGSKVSSDKAARISATVELAARDSSQQTVVVLKGAGTVVATRERYAVNATGNPGLATGGTGDVLTGVIAGLLAQGLDAWSAARLGVYVHGLAGDLAADELGQVSLIATDLIDHLPAAFGQMR